MKNQNSTVLEINLTGAQIEEMYEALQKDTITATLEAETPFGKVKVILKKEKDETKCKRCEHVKELLNIFQWS